MFLSDNTSIKTQYESCLSCSLNSKCLASGLLKYSENDSHLKTLRTHVIKNNEHVYHVGDKLQALYIVKSGCFKTYIINKSGDEQIINFHLPGDMLALEALDDHILETSAVALQLSSVCAVPLNQLEYLIDQIVPDWLMKIMMGKLHQGQRNFSVLGKKNAKTRLASFLLDMSRSYQELGYSGTRLKLSMSRQDIGNYLCLSSETISRVFSWMKRKGLLELDQRHVTIIDYKNLRELADNRL